MKIPSRKLRFTAAFIFAIVAVILFFYLAFLSFYQDKFFPGVKIAGHDVGGQNVFATADKLDRQFKDRKETQLSLIYQNQTFVLSINPALSEIDLTDSIHAAFAAGRSGNILKDLGDQFKLLLVGQNFNPNLKYKNFAQINSQINLINQKVRKEALSAQIVFSDTISVVPAQDGVELDDKNLLESMENYLTLKGGAPAVLPIKPLLPILTTIKAEKYKKALESVKTSPVTLHFGTDTWVIDQPTLYSLLDFDNTKTEIASLRENGQDFTIKEMSFGKLTVTDSELLLDSDKLFNYLTTIADKTDQLLKEAKFVFDEKTQRVTEFQPGQEGRKLNMARAVTLITAAVANNTANIELPVEKTYPKTSTGKINNFGIKELLGAGTSSFIDSIPNRVYNIGLSAAKTNGVLVPPGEIFSFNQYLGEVSSATGFKQAYVIKGGKTVLDDGGGVCQVSTTLFRAVLNAGLPIVERTAHAYRVGFYEQGGSPPGFDATVFPPSVDFKFKNDTSSYILVQNQMIGTTLTFQIYGTSDDRVVSIGKPVILSQTPPPPDLKQDDPTLPKGVEKEIEHSIWGMNTQFKRTVTRNGETLIDEVIRSNFRPWQKVTLVGTKQ